MSDRMACFLTTVFCFTPFFSVMAQADEYLDRLHEAILECEVDADQALRQIEATRMFLVRAGRTEQTFVDLLTDALPCVSGVYGWEMYLTDDLSFRSLAILELEREAEAARALRLQQCKALQERAQRFFGFGRLRLYPDEQVFLSQCLAERVLCKQ